MEKTIACANEIRVHLETLATTGEFAGNVHFRPTESGVTMVGLRPDRPQRGRGGYSAVRLAQDFEREFHRHCVAIEQGRPTPEKRLQSFLLSHAYRHERRLDIVDCSSGLIFVTDEIPAATGDGKILCDLLALRLDGDRCVPVQIELKSARDMTRLIQQLADYSAFINANREIYETLFSALLGRSIRFTDPVEKWLVWPAARKDGTFETDAREQELGDLGIGVVQYRENQGVFAFHVGRHPIATAEDCKPT